jgi:DNA repair protein RadC
MSDPIEDTHVIRQAQPKLWRPAEPLPDSPQPAAAPAPSSGAATPTPAKSASSPVERYNPTIKELPADERPRERLFAHGPQALSTAELLAILIRVGTPERSAVALGEYLLAHFGNLGAVAGATVEELAAVKGLGDAKAAQIKAAIEFGTRVAAFGGEARYTIGCPQDAANLFMPDMRFLKKETMKSALLDARQGVIAVKTISIGDLTSSIVHPREVFKDAILASAASIVVAHNHPSGDPTPSREDRLISMRLIAAGEMLGIELDDHLIIGDGIWVSLKQRGLLATENAAVAIADESC